MVGSTKALTLRQLEDEELALRRSLLTLPAVVEETKHGVEERALHAKQVLQKESDALIDEADGYRKRQRGLRSDIEARQAQLVSANDTVEDLRRKVAGLEEREAALKRRQQDLKEAATARAARQDRERATLDRAEGARYSSPPSHSTGNDVGGRGPKATSPSASPVRFDEDELDGAVRDARGRHAALLEQVDSVSDKLHTVSARKAELASKLEALRRVHAQLAAARSDANVVEAAAIQAEHDAFVAELETVRSETIAKCHERRSMIEHLLEGFEERTAQLTVLRRRAASRVSAAGDAAADQHAAASPSRGGVLATDIDSTTEARRRITELLRNATTEHETLEEYVAVLHQRLADAQLRLEVDTYEFDVAAGHASPGRGVSPGRLR